MQNYIHIMPVYNYILTVKFIHNSSFNYVPNLAPYLICRE